MADDFVPGQTECIHLIHPSASGKIKRQAFTDGPVKASGGEFDIACCPGSSLPTYATSETVAVTCPLCKTSEVFKKINAEQTSPLGASEADMAVLKHMPTNQPQ